MHPNIGELDRRQVTNLKDLLKNDSTKLKTTEIVRSLIDRIEVAPRGKRGESTIILSGALASILNDASGAGTLDSSYSQVGRVFLVAGVGFEPTTFRL